MRLDTPRVDPIAEEALPESARIKVGDAPTLNIFRTLAHHPDLLRRWLTFGNHIMLKSTLPDRDREILILRVGWLCRSGYEWGQHVVIGRAVGLSEEDITRIGEGPEAEGWSPHERALMRAADELHADSFISDETWSTLCNVFNTQQMMDAVFTVGQYQLVSMALNSIGVQPEEGLPPLPDAASR